MPQEWHDYAKAVNMLEFDYNSFKNLGAYKKAYSDLDLIDDNFPANYKKQIGNIEFTVIMLKSEIELYNLRIGVKKDVSLDDVKKADEEFSKAKEEFIEFYKNKN
jgi:hypothetical protein